MIIKFKENYSGLQMQVDTACMKNKRYSNFPSNVRLYFDRQTFMKME